MFASYLSVIIFQWGRGSSKPLLLTGYYVTEPAPYEEQCNGCPPRRNINLSQRLTLLASLYFYCLYF